MCKLWQQVIYSWFDSCNNVCDFKMTMTNLEWTVVNGPQQWRRLRGTLVWHSSWRDAATGDEAGGHQESHPPTGPDSAQSYRLFLSPRDTWMSNDAVKCASNRSQPHRLLWVTFNYCRPFGAVLKFSSLDYSILISIWNYPITSSGSWLCLDVFFF